MFIFVQKFCIVYTFLVHLPIFKEYFRIQLFISITSPIYKDFAKANKRLKFIPFILTNHHEEKTKISVYSCGYDRG